ncbi:MAG: ThuA domain-containing protein, partial [Fimbriimonadales bacterium]|nr:ThuA domain-containing protein [Fimbriimonadales bacterium]
MLWGLFAVILAVNASPGIPDRISLSSFSKELEEETRVSRKEDPLRILFFTKTSGFRHSSIPVAIKAMEKMA